MSRIVITVAVLVLLTVGLALSGERKKPKDEHRTLHEMTFSGTPVPSTYDDGSQEVMVLIRQPDSGPCDVDYESVNLRLVTNGGGNTGRDMIRWCVDQNVGTYTVSFGARNPFKDKPVTFTAPSANDKCSRPGVPKDGTNSATAYPYNITGPKGPCTDPNVVVK